MFFFTLALHRCESARVGKGERSVLGQHCRAGPPCPSSRGPCRQGREAGGQAGRCARCKRGGAFGQLARGGRPCASSRRPLAAMRARGGSARAGAAQTLPAEPLHPHPLPAAPPPGAGAGAARRPSPPAPHPPPPLTHLTRMPIWPSAPALIFSLMRTSSLRGGGRRMRQAAALSSRVRASNDPVLDAHLQPAGRWAGLARLRCARVF